MTVNSEEQIMIIIIPNKLMLLCMDDDKPYKKRIPGNVFLKRFSLCKRSSFFCLPSELCYCRSGLHATIRSILLYSKENSFYLLNLFLLTISSTHLRG